MHRLALCLWMLVVQISLPVLAQAAPAKWEVLTSDEFETYRYVFAPYGIAAHRNDLAVLKLEPVIVFRIEGNDFCAGMLCQTIVLLNCPRPICPNTSVFAKREVEFDRGLTRHFGGTQFLVFQLSSDRRAERDIVVMFNERFVSVWRGFGEN